MKRIINLVVFALIIGVLTACSGSASGSASGSDSYPNKAINLLVAYDAGGGTDLTARTLAPFLEEELGVTVNVVNRPGGSGWVGWTELANSKSDGYTIGYLNSPNFPGGLANPTVEREIDYDSFEILANHVTDPNVIAILPDDNRFSNFKEFVEYAKSNELSANTTGVASDEHLTSLLINKNLDTKIKPVHFEGTSDSLSAILGGHIDVLVSSAGEAYNLHEEGQIKIIAVTAPERSVFLPDVPTVEELGYGPIYMAATRGIVTPAGIDEEIKQKLEDALEKAINNPEQIKKSEELGTQVQYMNAEEYKESLEKDRQSVDELKDLLEW